MKELSDIVAAFDALCGEGRPAALATVVAVEGSAYRRPGARLLVAEDGRTWGGVSGGCLERDVARRARGVIATGRPVVARYDTTDDEQLPGGVATGCRGAVELFIEPLSADAPGPIPLLADVLRERRPRSLATVIRATGSLAGLVGHHLDLDERRSAADAWADDELRSAAVDALAALADGERATVVHHRTPAGAADVFVERVAPPQSLVVFGAGPDAAPLVAIAKALGWHVTVVGARPATGIAGRFAAADAVCVTSSDAPAAGVDVRPDGAVVLMTHNYARDAAILAGLRVRPRYLGILGPRERADELLAGRSGAAAAVVGAVFAPIGLDLGAETPEEIALAIVAEIQAVFRRAAGGPLRDRAGPIHARDVSADLTHATRDRAWAASRELPDILGTTRTSPVRWDR